MSAPCSCGPLMLSGGHVLPAGRHGNDCPASTPSHPCLCGHTHQAGSDGEPGPCWECDCAQWAEPWAVRVAADALQRIYDAIRFSDHWDVGGGAFQAVESALRALGRLP